MKKYVLFEKTLKKSGIKGYFMLHTGTIGDETQFNKMLAENDTIAFAESDDVLSLIIATKDIAKYVIVEDDATVHISDFEKVGKIHLVCISNLEPFGFTLCIDFPLGN